MRIGAFMVATLAQSVSPVAVFYNQVGPRIGGIVNVLAAGIIP